MNKIIALLNFFKLQFMNIRKGRSPIHGWGHREHVRTCSHMWELRLSRLAKTLNPGSAPRRGCNCCARSVAVVDQHEHLENRSERNQRTVTNTLHFGTFSWIT